MAINQKWKDTMLMAIKDAKWDAYDVTIKAQVALYEKKFPALKDKVNWLLIKAMVWTESGGVSSASWATRVIQIGNAGDPAYAVLKKGSEGSELIMSDALKKSLTEKSIDDAQLNIEAGIAYLYTRMAKSLFQSIRDAKDGKVYEYVVLPGDNLDKIANKVGTTLEEIKKQNPAASGIIQPKMKLKYIKAKTTRVITGWYDFTADTIAERYNGGGDANYAEKLKFILSDVIPHLKR
ncbi:MAG: LysM peptidoglycan-binding domain-containing protein [Moraxellaceae bacterium]|nr:MAG: LysM peptidoglycan-binding domain-containing protein [Moraxellaceae bacterium]